MITGGNIHTVSVTGHSIWLIPSEPQFSYWESLIQKIAAVHGTPSFAPHITLLGQLEQNRAWIQRQLGNLCEVIEPFSLELDRFGMLDHYFRSLFLYVATAPNLNQLWKSTVHQFQIKQADTYMPHLSLLYSNLSKSEKNKLLANLEVELPQQITIDKIVLMETNGSPDLWQEVDHYPLESAQKHPQSQETS